MSQGLFDDGFNREKFTWLHQHLSSTATILQELEEGIICQGNALLFVIEYFFSGKARVFKLLHLLIDLIVNSVKFLGREPFERATGRLIGINEVLLILTMYLLLLLGMHVVVMVM